MTLRIIYTIFLGILLAAFIGVGIAAFYPQPRYPEYPTELNYKAFPAPEPSSTQEAELIQKQKDFDIKQKEFSKMNESYGKNVSLLAIGFSIAILIVSILIASRLLILSDGLLLGGLLTLGYGIIRGFSPSDSMFRFVIISIGLAVALILGYVKFIKPQRKNT